MPLAPSPIALRTLHASVPLLQLTNATVVKGTTQRAGQALSRRFTTASTRRSSGRTARGRRTLLNLLTFEDRALAEPGAAAGGPACSAATTGTCSNCARRSASSRPTCTGGSSPATVRDAISGEDAVISGLLRHAGHAALRGRSPVRCARRRDTRWSASRRCTWPARRLDEMSTGEARRVLIARALVNRPRALRARRTDDRARRRRPPPLSRNSPAPRQGRNHRHPDHAPRRGDHPGDRTGGAAGSRPGCGVRREGGDADARAAAQRDFRRAGAVSRANGTQRARANLDGPDGPRLRVCVRRRSSRSAHGRRVSDLRHLLFSSGVAERVQDQRNGFVHLAEPRPLRRESAHEAVRRQAVEDRRGGS